ncbi:MAG: Radical domain protein [Deltaproteobacteria bacterium]|nr:Radical domain protein [Deltaproteobacteria bacterium]
MISRRAFIQTVCLSALALQAGAREIASGVAGRREALWYQKLDDGKGTVQCALCPRRCTIPAGGSGFCRARKNFGGTLTSLGYALPCSINVDPVEKKPLFNFHPSTRSLSLACAGCNLRCKFCQNWEISQLSPLESRNYLTPVAQVPTMAIARGCKSVAFTYTEPVTFFEYMLDVARAARGKGVLAITHSNGYINPEPQAELCRHLDAANIDLKGFSEKFYDTVCEGALAPVLTALKNYRQRGVWLEVTNLVIPGYNDSPAMIAEMCGWIRQNLGEQTPVHFSRFFPLYKMSAVPPTPVKTLEMARETALQAGLHYPYIGNVPGHPGASTYCPQCRKVVIQRSGFSVLETHLKGDRCSFCSRKIAGAGFMTGGTRI